MRGAWDAIPALLLMFGISWRLGARVEILSERSIQKLRIGDFIY